ncbi:MAG: polysaccharide export protein [Gammaproteobacteria bacterium]|nr:polysaccharide export protein [Gammaproteobacteria bacterium]MBU1624482.1 polysaccharide export protein [Gammaproteobacteria bacterium]MBU1982326.1 polysaccharide export protein [Gammaproteobacteria bacterium]
MRILVALLTILIAAPAAALDYADPLGVQGALGLTPSTTISTPVAAAPAVPPPAVMPPPSGYASNTNSDVFGAQLFTGSFAQYGATQFNPDYLIAAGDKIQVRLWGGFNFDSVLTVDPQGNLFLPQVGPVQVMGVRNAELQRAVELAASKVFRSNVNSYANLAAAQPVRVFVGGNVRRPGLYNGTSMDSVLHYLDQAGGIDLERGSFLDIQVKRGEQTRGTLNLYDFLLAGRIPLLQLSDGDVIFVTQRRNTVRVSGQAENAKLFEFKASALALKELMGLAKPLAQTTHVRIVRNSGTTRNVEYYPLEKAGDVYVSNGDEAEFTSDKKTGTITVRVEGEHKSPQEYVLPYGARLGELMKRIQLTEQSDESSIQLLRVSVRDRQSSLLETSLRSLESTVLTARSGTSDEARLRKDEADMILQWIDRAKKIVPSGQVQIAQAENRDTLLLENGDIIKIPVKDGLVLVSGEVLFPNAIAFDSELDLDDYVERAGGYTQNADNSRIILAHRDGSFQQDSGTVRAGDDILVLPKVDVKSRQIWKDMTQIIYQIAISAKVVFGL